MEDLTPTNPLAEILFEELSDYFTNNNITDSEEAQLIALEASTELLYRVMVALGQQDVQLYGDHGNTTKVLVASLFDEDELPAQGELDTGDLSTDRVIH